MLWTKYQVSQGDLYGIINLTIISTMIVERFFSSEELAVLYSFISSSITTTVTVLLPKLILTSMSMMREREEELISLQAEMVSAMKTEARGPNSSRDTQAGISSSSVLETFPSHSGNDNVEIKISRDGERGLRGLTVGDVGGSVAGEDEVGQQAVEIRELPGLTGRPLLLFGRLHLRLVVREREAGQELEDSLETSQ